MPSWALALEILFPTALAQVKIKNSNPKTRLTSENATYNPMLGIFIVFGTVLSLNEPQISKGNCLCCWQVERLMVSKEHLVKQMIFASESFLMFSH